MEENRQEKNIIEVFKNKFVKVVYKDGLQDRAIKGLLIDFDINFVYIERFEGDSLKAINTTSITSITHNKNEEREDK